MDAQRGVVDGCWVFMVGEAMEQFAIEGIDHMVWDAWSGQFIKTTPGPTPDGGEIESPVTLKAADAAPV